MSDFKGRNVLVVGAGRGIGKRLAIGFANAGARVGLLARSKPELDLAYLEIEHGGGHSSRLKADITDREELTAAIDRYRMRHGFIGIVICAAAAQGPIGPFLETPAKAWMDTVEDNIAGVANVCRAVLRPMVQQRSGKIIILAGPGAAEVRPNFSAYATSKAAIVRFVETVAEELLDSNVQINCMTPGATYTSQTDEILRAGDLAGWKEIEIAGETRRTGGTPPDKQIQLAMFLASEQSNHITGKLIHVNDNWRRLKHINTHPGMFTLRRVTRV